MTEELLGKEAQKKLLVAQNIILLHFALCCAGLFKLTWAVSRISYQHLDFDVLISHLCDWIAVFNHTKLPQILFFTISLCALFVFYGLAFYAVQTVNKKKKLWVNTLKPLHWMVYFICISLINLWACLHLNALSALLWALGFITLPAILCLQDVKELLLSTHNNRKIGPRGCWIITGIISLILVLVFFPIIFKPLQIINEFMAIPEQTILQNGRVVDNAQFVNRHHLGGLHLYDPRKAEEKPGLVGVNIQKAPLLDVFLSKPEHLMFSYDDKTQFLSVKGRISPASYQALLKAYANKSAALEKINVFFAKSYALQKFYKSQTYTAKEQDFLKKNALEQNLKIKAGWFFFHNSWVLNPILALALGADAKHQVFLYGWGSTVFLKQALSLLGGVSFQNYFKSIYSFYPLYFLVFLAALYGIFRRIDFVCIGALLLSASIWSLQYQMILLAPGYNPIRHFFDMIILLLFYLYLQKNKAVYLLACVCLGFIGIAWSKDFGLFLFLSLSGTSILKLMTLDKFSWKKTIFWTVAIVMGLILYKLPHHGENHNLIYMLLGYTIPGTSTFMIGFILSILSFIYLMYIKYKNTTSPYYWLSLCVFFYLQLQLIYYIWNPSYHHLLVSTSTMITLGLTWCVLLGKNRHSKPSIGLISCIILFSIYLTTLLGFYLDKLHYKQNFSTHVVHDWAFEYGKFQTPMEPQVFEETIRLIHHYEHHPSMYLISKYDSILPVLAHRYHALPVVNLALDLISNYDLTRCIEQINKTKPQYVFVDTDIMRDLRPEIPEKHGDPRLGDPSGAYGRVSAYMNMKKLFLLIKDDYQPIQKGGLLTVYQRKPGV